MDYKIAVLPGDGIGEEIIEQGLNVLHKIGELYSHKFEIVKGDIGGIAIDNHDTPLPQTTIDMCKDSDAVLLGAVGGPKWDNLGGNKRPEAGLLGIRKELELYTNLRPALVYNALKDACPIKDSIIGEGLDICVVRELTGGIYFGEKNKGEGFSSDLMIYHEEEVRRIAIQAFEIARQRRKKVTSVDKANVLETSRLWRKVVIEVAAEYPDVILEHLYVDNAAMQLVINPGQFDVIVTGNLFGDILSDEASMITGSIGMLPSASIGGKIGLYEPVHGSAPDIAFQNKANPIATILSIAMMLKYSFKLEKEAASIEAAVEKFLEDGYRTSDLTRGGAEATGTKEAGKIICDNLK